MDWEIVTGISSTIIALCALVYTVWQGKQMQTHNKLSFRPHLDSWTHNDTSKGVYTVDIINNGLGPAVIQSFIVKVDGEIVGGKADERIGKVLEVIFPNLSYQYHQGHMTKNYSMSPKEKCTILAIQFKPPIPLSADDIARALDRADLIINYKSIYGEEFTYSSAEEKSNKPQELTGRHGLASR